MDILEMVEQAALRARDEFNNSTDCSYGVLDAFARSIRQIIIEERERARKIVG